MGTTVLFKKLHKNAQLPERQTLHSAGADLRAIRPYMLPAGEWMAVSCGFAMALPEGYEAQIRPRSGLALNHGVTVLNAPGTVDSDYRGEMKVILINHGKSPFPISPGDRIAQMVIARVPAPTSLPFAEVEELDETPRGTGGFGSTGRN